MISWLSIVADVIIVMAFLVQTRTVYRGLKIEAMLKQQIADKDEPRH